jgi:hypothetical protein
MAFENGSVGHAQNVARTHKNSSKPGTSRLAGRPWIITCTASTRKKVSDICECRGKKETTRESVSPDELCVVACEGKEQSDSRPWPGCRTVTTPCLPLLGRSSRPSAGTSAIHASASDHQNIAACQCALVKS